MDIAAPPRLSADASGDALIEALRAAIGAASVLTSLEERTFFSQDVYRAGVTPIAVVQPDSVEAVQACAALCQAAGAAIVPRGGGLSYTDGYLPIQARSVTFDLGKLNRVVRISAPDLFATVEAGCTWEALDEALKPHGLRAAYWGPVSGRQATIGGTLSQNSVFWGAVRHGVASQNVLGLDVVLADGSLLGVGSHGGGPDAPPFFRHYGSELTGAFTGDCGAMGLKVRATLPLVRRPAFKGAASFAFDSADAMLEALGRIARDQLVAEAMLFDASQRDVRVTNAKMSLPKMLRSFADVAKASGVGAALAMALHGTRFMQDGDYSIHLMLEADSSAELKRQSKAAGQIARDAGGWEIPPTIPRVLSARPFPEPGAMLGQSRFLPVHGIVAQSLAMEAYRGVMDIFGAHAQAARALGVTTGMFGCALPGAILLEPTCHWPGPSLESHARLYGKAPHMLTQAPLNSEAEALVVRIRQDLHALFGRLGAAHLQIGKQYPFRASRNAANWALLSALKATVDPNGLMNPGALGFEAPPQQG